MNTCEHSSSIVLFDEGNLSVGLCTWDCGEVLISVRRGIMTTTRTASELKQDSYIGGFEVETDNGVEVCEPVPVVTVKS